MARTGPVFDQRHQSVRYQWNAAGDINFGAVASCQEFASQIAKLGVEVKKAAEAGALNEEQATEAEYNLRRAGLAAAKPEASKTDLTNYLAMAKEAIKDVTALSGLAAAITDAVQRVRDIF